MPRPTLRKVGLLVFGDASGGADTSSGSSVVPPPRNPSATSSLFVTVQRSSDGGEGTSVQGWGIMPRNQNASSESD
eukprot:2009808-Pyramimonas_sp.AAC.1